MTKKRASLFFIIIFFALFFGCTLAEQTSAIPVNSAYDKFRITDGSGRFKKHTFLSDMLISNIVWIDNVHLLATIGEGAESARYADMASRPQLKSHPLGKMIVINTDTGEIKDFGYDGGVKCLVDGNIIISLSTSNSDKTSDNKIAFGKLEGEIIIEPEPDRKTTRLNNYDCLYSKIELVAESKNIFGQRIILKAKHGILNSDVTLDDGVATSELSLLKPSNEKVSIPTNVGETNFKVSYVSHEDAYLVTPYLKYDNYATPWWKIHPKAIFIRLLYPNGEVKRIPLPKVIEDKIKDIKQFSFRDVLHTRLGLMWSLTPRNGKTFLPPVYYLQSGNELIELHDDVSTPSPDGCKLIGPYLPSFSDKLIAKARKNSSLQNYYFIDLCQEN